VPGSASGQMLRRLTENAGAVPLAARFAALAPEHPAQPDGAARAGTRRI